MKDIREIQIENQEDTTAIMQWCDDIYRTLFEDYFKDVRELHTKLLSRKKPITDSELEYVLTLLPLNLFQVAERLNKLKLELEIAKSKMKQKKKEYENASTESTQTRRLEYAQHMIIEDELLCTAYATVIGQVESEISFSRELIMASKKIFDSRKIAQTVNPVSESTTDPKNKGQYDLPDYKAEGQYVK